MRTGCILYDPELNEVWAFEYFGWIEGWLATRPGRQSNKSYDNSKAIQIDW